MKLLPLVLTLTAAALLMGCGHPTAGPTEADKEAQERLAEEQLAQQQSQLHEQQAALDERERELNERQSQLTVAAPAPPPPAAPQEQAPPEVANAPEPPPVAAEPAEGAPNASLQEFYDALSPYGSWLQMSPYGYVWQPNATLQDQNWRPYTEGHWVDTDEGWTWVSDEPFGWATYHYGRWMRTHTQGWVWVPGDQWAPAWVSWRYGNDFVGWAPLPPEATLSPGPGIQQWADQQYGLSANDYTFVPAAEFGDDSMAPEEVPFDQNPAIYDESNNITDMYYGDGGYTIISYGPNYDFMRSKSHRRLHSPYKISRGGYHAHGNNGAVATGDTLQVTAPRIARTKGSAAPKTVHSTVFDARLVSIPTVAPAHGSGIAPLYHPPQTATALPGARTAGQLQPGQPSTQAGVPPVMQPSAPGVAHAPYQQIQTAGRPALDAHKTRDVQIIEQEQSQRAIDQQRQEASQLQAAQEAQQAAEAARAQREAIQAQQSAEASARIAHEQAAAAHAQAAAAHAEAARVEAYRSVQPVQAVNNSSSGQGNGTGRNQQ